MATPLFIVLLVIETTDLVFALDSLPAVLAITKDGFVALTSNIFAILGLRSLYFALNGVMQLFRFLKIGLARHPRLHRREDADRTLGRDLNRDFPRRDRRRAHDVRACCRCSSKPPGQSRRKIKR